LQGFALKRLLIPNEDLITGRVTNWSYSSDLIRQSVHVAVSYGSDVRLAMRLAVEAAGAASRSLEIPEPTCLLKEFGDSAVILELRFWIRDPANGTANVRSEVMLRIWDSFHEHGIEFPFPQRDCGGGVTATCLFSMAIASASERTPSQRSSMLKLSPPRMTCR
jgi:small-conductance mechanosensitive channel